MKKILASFAILLILSTSVSAEGPTTSENLQVQDTIDQAAMARSSGNMDRAIQLYQNAIALEPNNFALYRNVGVLYYEKGDYLASAKSLLSANKLKPDDAFTLVYTAKVLVKLDDPESAKPYLEQAERIDPNNAELFIAQGDVYRKLGQTSEAERSYQQAVRTAPENSSSYAGLGLLYYEDRQYKIAAQYFEEALKRSPENGDTWYNLGMTYLALNDLNKAAECMHRSLTYRPNNAETFNALGKIFERARMWDLAEKSFVKSLEIDPDYAPARNNLDHMRWEMNRAEFQEMSTMGSPYESRSQRMGPVTFVTSSRRQSGFSDDPFDRSRSYQSRTGYDPFNNFNSRYRRRPSFDPVTGYNPQTGYADTAPGDGSDALMALGAALVQGLFNKKSDE